jgi:NifU-like protein
MAYDVIKKAASLYKGVDMESFEDEIIVCECARVSLSTIKEVIKLNDLKTVEEITDYTKAGAFCKSCIKPGGHEAKEYYLVDILKDVREEMDRERAKNEPVDFNSLNLVQKISAIQKVIDSKISPALAADGGGIELVDLTDNVIKVKLQGACAGCPSSMATLKGFVEQVFQQEVAAELTVEQVF